ncbi:RidA family protein [Roseibium sp.]|uniref:RidA family protein n=1 Tax=Roseibium sp. TaxID=1936156 RepID=UPI003D106E28
MSDIKRLESGPRMSQAVIHGGLVYLAGQVGNAGDSVADQTRTILENIETLLEKSGSDKSRILQATIWLETMDDFAEMNSVWDAWVDPANPPARACGESRLATPDYKVEIIIVAAAKD